MAQQLLERALDRGRGVRLAVEGGCMRPLIHPGDEVDVRPAPRLRAGDVVLARTRAGELVCHRVLQLRDDGALLAGDRSSRPELHPGHSILGQVTAVRRRRPARRIDLGRGRWLGRLSARAYLGSYRRRHHATGRILDAARRRWLVPAVAVLASRFAPPLDSPQEKT